MRPRKPHAKSEIGRRPDSRIEVGVLGLTDVVKNLATGKKRRFSVPFTGISPPVMWKSWERELVKATEIYNDTIHLTNGSKPRIAIDPLAHTPATPIANAIQNAPNPPNVKPWDLYTPVRLIIPKGALGKHEKSTFSQEIYSITNRRGLQPGRTSRCEITRLHPNQVANPGATIGASIVAST